MSELIEPKAVPVAVINTVEIAPFHCQTPSDWDLTLNEDGSLTAHSPVSGETFEGTMANFNKAMRG
jgi:hypothetical protein